MSDSPDVFGIKKQVVAWIVAGMLAAFGGFQLFAIKAKLTEIVKAQVTAANDARRAETELLIRNIVREEIKNDTDPVLDNIIDRVSVNETDIKDLFRGRR